MYLLFAAVAALAFGFAGPSAADSVDVIPMAAANATSIGEYISSASGFDSPKVTPINSTSYDWWYFDVVSDDQQYSIIVVFLSALGTAFLTDLPDDAILLGSLLLTAPELPSQVSIQMPATEAVVITNEDGATGSWQGSGMQFYGAADLSSYCIDLDIPSVGLNGSVQLDSVAPPHYPGGPAIAGQSMVIMPGVGWANAIPDASTEVVVQVNDTEARFTGVGYHDKNWGTSVFVDNVASWYWGHGRLGPYSIVWYDALSPEGDEYVSGYVATDGEILFAANNSVTVRPTGANDTYPPKAGDVPNSYHIVFEMGDVGVMEFDVAGTLFYDEGGFYERWVASLTGGIVGQQNYTGTALLEQFALES